MTTQVKTVSSDFLGRRIHSLMGLWLIVYLFEHLLVNSQATLWIGDDGHGFVQMVNLLESLPYLQVVEVLLIGIPLLIHMIWGVKRALTAKTNSSGSSGRAPVLKTKRNRAFTWQRITSWILLFGIVGHVVQMRFVEMPKKTELDYKEWYLTQIGFDEGLLTLAPRIGAVLFTAADISALEREEPVGDLEQRQRMEERNGWIRQMRSFDLKEGEVVAMAPLPGKAMLLMIRNTFKNPWMIGLYTIFVLAAAFHAFNGFWTALITWGILLSYRSQKAMLPFCWIGVTLLSFLGLASIWGSYWNLRS